MMESRLYLSLKMSVLQPSIDLISKINISFRPKSILDIGCGRGTAARHFCKDGPEQKLTGIDISPT